MYICMCYGITDKTIASVVKNQGVGNIRELKQHLELGSQCGKCIQMAQEVIDSTIIDDALFKEVC